MDLFLEKESYTEEDVHKTISLKVEESIHLDFKQADSLDFKDKKKAEIAKDVSAFANSAGGIIIYGIKEENHVAESISYIDGSVYTKEWLEQLLQTRIQRKIEGLKIFPVRINDDIKKSVYILKIPESLAAPHMTSDKRFYKRYNFESVQMEEYEIRNLYHRKENTELRINNVVAGKEPKITSEDDGEHIFVHMTFQVENIGNVIERDYKIIVSFNFSEYIVKFERFDPNVSHSLINENERILTFSNTCPIFSKEIITIGAGNFGFPTENFEKLMETASIKVKLLYSNGSDELEMDLKHIFEVYGLTYD